MRKKKLSALLSVFALAALTTAAFAACGETEAHVHKYTSSVTKQATCTEEGVETFTCEAGDDSYTKPIAKLSHKYSEKVTKEATCAEEGEKTFTCDNCGDSYTESIAKLDHKYSEKVTKEATCAEEGEKTFTCDNCGDSYTEAIAKLDHTIVIDEAVEATEESTGLTEGKHCSVCGEVLVAQTEIPKKEPAHEHSFVNYEVTKKATCTEIGIRTYTCDCGETYIRKLAALGHTGYEDDGECTRCDYSAQAKVGDTYYLTLDEALAAVTGDTATVTLNSDAKLSDDFTATNLALTLTMGNYTLDLGGYTLAVATFNANSDTTDGFTIKNGTIEATNGGTIAAPNGTVTLNNVNGISGSDTGFTLNAAQNSLHFEGIVNFFKKTDANTTTPAPVSIPVDTHVVAEKNATVTVAAINVVAGGSSKEFSLEINVGAKIVTSNAETATPITVANEVGNAKVSVAMNEEAESAVSVSGANVVAIETFTQSANEKTTVTSTVVAGIGSETVSVDPSAEKPAISVTGDGSNSDLSVGTTENIINGESNNLIITLPEGAEAPTTNGVAEVNGVMYATLKAAIENVTDGATITLQKDIINAEGMAVASEKNFTVDFAGHTYTLNKPGAGSTGTETSGFQLLKNSTITFKNGTINISEDNLTRHPDGRNIKRIIQNYAELTLEDMTIDGTNQYGGASYIMSFNNQPVRIIGNTNVIAAKGKVAFDVDGYWGSYDRCQVTIDTTGTIVGNIEVGQGILTINNANVVGGIVFCNSCGEVQSEQIARMSITGGTFTSDPSAYLAEGYVAESISDKYVVHGSVKVGDSYYTTLAEAVAKAESGATVTLLKNTTVTSTVVVTKELTLDLNGNNITGSSWVLQAQGANGDLTVTGNGTVKSTGNCVANAINGAKLTIKSGTYEAQESCVMAFDGATVVIDGGTFTTVDNFVVGTNGSTGRGKNSITINNGTFNGNIKTSGYIACGIYVANDDTVVVNGGTFNVVNGVGILARSGNTTVSDKVVFNVTSDGTIKEGKVGDAKINIEIPHDIVLDQKAGYPGGDPTVVAPAYKAYKKVGNDNQLFYTKQLPEEVVVECNGIYYASLTEAIAKAESGATVTLLKNTTVTSTVVVTKELTLDLNGNNITGSSWVLQAQGANGDLTVTGNGTVKSTGNCVANAINGAKLTIKSGTYEAQESCVMAFDGATVVIDGGTFTTVDNFVVGTNGSTGRGKNSITINNGTFNGNIKTSGYIACGIYVANDDTVVVNGGTFNVVNGVGILARSGNTTVSDKVVFNVTSDGSIKEGKVGDAKINIEIPHDIVVDSLSDYPGGVPTVNAPKGADMVDLSEVKA